MSSLQELLIILGVADDDLYLVWLQELNLLQLCLLVQ